MVYKNERSNLEKVENYRGLENGGWIIERNI